MPDFIYDKKIYYNPVEFAMDRIGGTWKMPILWRLRDRAWRYGELKRDLGRITHKMLSEQLRELERDGVITRTVLGAVPAHVEYALTPLGHTTVPLIDALRAWGASYRATLGGNG